MSQNWNSPLINVLTSVDADVLRQIFVEFTKELNRLSDELDKMKQG